MTVHVYEWGSYCCFQLNIICTLLAGILQFLLIKNNKYLKYVQWFYQDRDQQWLSACCLKKKKTIIFDSWDLWRGEAGVSGESHSSSYDLIMVQGVVSWVQLPSPSNDPGISYRCTRCSNTWLTLSNGHSCETVQFTQGSTEILEFVSCHIIPVLWKQILALLPVQLVGALSNIQDWDWMPPTAAHCHSLLDRHVLQGSMWVSAVNVSTETNAA